jgi:hypothetical protein
MKNDNVFTDLVLELRNAFLSDPQLRAPLLSWVDELVRKSSVEEIERSSILAEMFGPDFTG